MPSATLMSGALPRNPRIFVEMRGAIIIAILTLKNEFSVKCVSGFRFGSKDFGIKALNG
jgi:hypothetical protein